MGAKFLSGSRRDGGTKDGMVGSEGEREVARNEVDEGQ